MLSSRTSSSAPAWPRHWKENTPVQAGLTTSKAPTSSEEREVVAGLRAGHVFSHCSHSGAAVSFDGRLPPAAGRGCAYIVFI